HQIHKHTGRNQKHDQQPRSPHNSIVARIRRDSKRYSRYSGLPAVWGYTSDGRYIMAVYDELDETTILPVTASTYEVPEPR
ncbi:MAG TPA: hypothetical protein VMY42_00550, partial [Thermoguttaceae bacterium]|nr:hypothetical protein [Thermoguttaceae bacterium]